VGKLKKLSQPEPRLISFVLMSAEANGEKKTGLERIIQTGMMRLELNHARVVVVNSDRKRQRLYQLSEVESFAPSLVLISMVLDILDRIIQIGEKIPGEKIVVVSIRNGEML
jgi:hypothetical protein